MLFETKNPAESEQQWRKAVRELAQADATLAALICRVGPCHLGIAWRRNYFAALVEAIIYQQLARKAAEAILARFRAVYPSGRFPTAEEVDRTPARRLMEAGLSPQKISYLRELARGVLEGSFRLRGFSAMEDEEVIGHLTQLKGIGRWTAEMFLIFCLGRQDVLPLNDLGIRKAVQNTYGFRHLPSAERLERMGLGWRPYRSVAAWYLWESADGKK